MIGYAIATMAAFGASAIVTGHILKNGGIADPTPTNRAMVLISAPAALVFALVALAVGLPSFGNLDPLDWAAIKADIKYGWRFVRYGEAVK